LPPRAFDRDDLILEMPRCLRGCGTLLAFDGKRILHLAGDAVPLGDVFGGDPHQDFAERIGQGAVERVEQNRVAQLPQRAVGA
jgi:hypothetical protein